MIAVNLYSRIFTAGDSFFVVAALLLFLPTTRDWFRARRKPQGATPSGRGSESSPDERLRD
jgi:hypothetical protein